MNDREIASTPRDIALIALMLTGFAVLTVPLVAWTYQTVNSTDHPAVAGLRMAEYYETSWPVAVAVVMFLIFHVKVGRVWLRHVVLPAAVFVPVSVAYAMAIDYINVLLIYLT